MEVCFEPKVTCKLNDEYEDQISVISNICYLIFVVSAVIVAPVAISMGYHEYRLRIFSKELSSWAIGAGLEISNLKRKMTPGVGSGSYCSYFSEIIVQSAPDFIEYEILSFFQEKFGLPEKAFNPKVDLAVQRLNDSTHLSIYSGGYRSLLDPRCL